jgi:hypothetical protein
MLFEPPILQFHALCTRSAKKRYVFRIKTFQKMMKNAQNCFFSKKHTLCTTFFRTIRTAFHNFANFAKRDATKALFL